MPRFTIALAMLLLGATAQAQRLTESRAAIERTPPAPAAGIERPAFEVPGGRMAATGTLFALGGVFGGAIIGAEMACSGPDAESLCELGGGIIGALVGEVVMLPLGVHLASDRSSYGRKLLVSSGVMLAGIVFAPVTGGVSLLLAPPIQLMTVMSTERNAVLRESGAR